MSVRVSAGKFKHRVLGSVPGSATRPTTDSLRASIFSALLNYIDLQDVTVLDLYCGTGAFGIEAVSRGAALATLVDKDPRVCFEVNKTIHALEANAQIQCLCADAFEFLKSNRTVYDVIFLDPPYQLRACNNLVSKVAELNTLKDRGVIVAEFGVGEYLLPHPNYSVLWRKESTITNIEILQFSSRIAESRNE